MTSQPFRLITRFLAVSSAAYILPMAIVWPVPIDQPSDVTGDGQPHYSFISRVRCIRLRILEWTHIQTNF